MVWSPFRPGRSPVVGNGSVAAIQVSGATRWRDVGRASPDGMESEMSRAARVRLRMFGVRVNGVRVIQARPRLAHPSALAPPCACWPGSRSRSRSRYSCSDSESGDSNPTSDGGGVVVVWFFGALALGFCKCCGPQGVKLGALSVRCKAGRDESSLAKLVAGHRLIREMPSLAIPHPVHVALPRPSPQLSTMPWPLHTIVDKTDLTVSHESHPGTANASLRLWICT
ncbi:hypothetical protein BGZ61DRAFT_224686 [Ilyonectria robusta]|uniref:uncharacterized protein n=1 Tax=Ilyonectria robusta TaxID=1079257 RepID=UPI001E8DEA41|nr:uncharacterized protein BGZ61DRAFT_224686 [Ilyonectria robusta]KAH8706628.1 hypothetical protein BGZ61DRAFT_224686 [Ilyonectria robusta]